MADPGKQRREYYDHHGRKLKVRDENHRFSFECDQCGKCCHGADIPLTPYDILKIADYYGMSAREFLMDFTYWAIAPPSGIPLVFLKTKPSCPFNNKGLCNIYQVRPFLCRSYPVIGIATYNTSTDRVNIKYSLEKNCSNIKTKETQTIREWLVEQCGDTYLAENLKWSEFKVRLAGSEYPKEDKNFHNLFYNIVYASELPEDETSNPEEQFQAMLDFASKMDWLEAAKEAKFIRKVLTP